MGKNAKGFEFSKFATPRIIGGIAIAVIILWALSIIFSSSQGPFSKQAADRHEPAASTANTDSTSHGQMPAAEHPSPTRDAAADHAAVTGGHETTATGSTGHAGSGSSADTPAAHKTADSRASAARDAQTAAHGTSKAASGKAAAQHQAAKQPATEHQQPAAAAGHGAPAGGHAAQSPAPAAHGTASGHAVAVGAPAHKPKPKGAAFVEAIIQPMKYELEERWWGWRPNDIIDLTDNVNNYQMGVLEVTRRTVVALAERISRTGTTDAFDENLEQAMNWFMVKADNYWFPSAESKYREGLEDLQAYHTKLMQGNATFYTRTDNLIPLLASFEDLLGSCDENLVKQVYEDGTPVSHFDVDNYFFYTRGVASAMASILEAVHHDFLDTLESRNGSELLHHAIVSCQQAVAIDPWIVLDSDYNSVFANHRANMAAPISHAYFYIRVLIKTLST